MSCASRCSRRAWTMSSSRATTRRLRRVLGALTTERPRTSVICWTMKAAPPSRSRCASTCLQPCRPGAGAGARRSGCGAERPWGRRRRDRLVRPAVGGCPRAAVGARAGADVAGRSPSSPPCRHRRCWVGWTRSAAIGARGRRGGRLRSEPRLAPGSPAVHPRQRLTPAWPGSSPPDRGQGDEAVENAVQVQSVQDTCAWRAVEPQRVRPAPPACVPCSGESPSHRPRFDRAATCPGSTISPQVAQASLGVRWWPS